MPSVQLFDYESCQRAENAECHNHCQEDHAWMNIECEVHDGFTLSQLTSSSRSKQTGVHRTYGHAMLTLHAHTISRRTLASSSRIFAPTCGLAGPKAFHSHRRCVYLR